MVNDSKPVRLSKAATEFNVSVRTIVEFLGKKGHTIAENPNTKLSFEMYQLLAKEFHTQKTVKEHAQKKGINYSGHQTVTLADKKKPFDPDEDEFDADEMVIIKTTITDEISDKHESLKLPSIDEIAPVSPAEADKPKEKESKDEQEVVPAARVEKEEQTTAEEESATDAGQTDTDINLKESPAVQPKILGKIDLKEVKERSRPKRKKTTAKIKPAEKKEKEAEPPMKPPKAEPDTKVEEQPDAEMAGKRDERTEKEKVPVAEVESKKIDEESDLSPAAEKDTATAQPEKEAQKIDNFIPTEVSKLAGPKIIDKIDLSRFETKKSSDKKPVGKPVASSKDDAIRQPKKKRKRIRKKGDADGQKVVKVPERPKPEVRTKRDRREAKPVILEEDVAKTVKETLQKLTAAGKAKSPKYRKEKRQDTVRKRIIENERMAEDQKIIKVTEFVTVNDLANMMNVPVNAVISTCMALGLFVSINQRLDAETLAIVAEEFQYKVEFVSVDVQEAINELELEEDVDDQLESRSPVVTVMGHVDHGKTKLLDHIRNSNVIAGEAGGITQHIGAYEVTLNNQKKITFLDTPGHEAFTAMRARGAKLTDVAIIVIAADDNVMPQTVEAINHAQAAGVPIVFAINKIDKPSANPEKVKEELSKMNILVEDWGGKYQSQEISAKAGINVEILLEKVLLEAELLDLKANPDRHAVGAVIESSLDKGRGYVTKVLVQNGTLKTGEVVLAGSCFGKVKAMYNERNVLVKEAGPSAPVLLLGLNGAPQAGDSFNVTKDEKEARSIAIKRLQLQREQGIRTQKHITLDEIGRRIVIGDFKELNIIVKADVDGSVEALSDSLLKLSNEQVQVNVIHKSVGQVTESDVLLASASDAVIIGFQVRPSLSARKLAEQEQIDIRTYSIIYQAIEEIKAAIEGMLSPEIEERILCNIEVREVFKISKVGTVAGCMVLDGTVTRNTKVRIIRDGIVIYTGNLGSLKRFKDDVKEVKTGYECGLNIENFNDIKVGDIVEGFQLVEVKRKL